MQVSTDHQVEQLLRPAEFDVRPHLDAIVPLHEWVQALVQVDRRTGRDSLFKVVALEHSLHRHAAKKSEHTIEPEPGKPVAVPHDLGRVDVDDPGDLGQVTVGVLLDLVVGQPLSGIVAATGVADLGGGRADDEDRRVPKLLELSEFP